MMSTAAAQPLAAAKLVATGDVRERKDDPAGVENQRQETV
jgi:hypothetical protein